MKSFYLIVCFLLAMHLPGARAQNHPMPYSFRENNGQITAPDGSPRTDIDFSLQAPGMSLMIGDGQMHYQFSRLEGHKGLDSLRQLRRQVTAKQEQAPRTADGKPIQRVPNVVFHRLDVELVGANRQARVVREEERAETYRYYTKDKKEPQQRTVKAFGKIIYKDIYPHIDWVLYTSGTDFKYDFVVHPGGKVSDIRLQYKGADSLALRANGDLDVHTPAAIIREQAPLAYRQESHDTVPVRFKLDKHTLGFHVAPVKGTLVIDPGVEWATYMGGAGGCGIEAIATDHQGYVYLAGGAVTDANIITSGAYQSTVSSSAFANGFLAKVDSAGNLVWGTYISGVGDGPFGMGPYTLAGDVACDGYGHVYLSGMTWCDSGIATAGSFQSTYSLNAGGFFAPILMQFTDDGQLKWSTYYGASCASVGFHAIACDRQGNVYAAGYADSSTSTTYQLISPGAWQSAFAGGIPTAGYNNDALLVKFDSSGNRLWATYYGGAYDESIHDITCDSAGNVFLTGATSSPDNIATPGTFQPVPDPGTVYPSVNQERGGFVAKFSASGQRVWGTYINALGRGICINRYGQLYVSGRVNSTSDTMIAGSGAYLGLGLSERNDFLMRFDQANGQRVWGTYYGGEFQAGSNEGNVSCDNNGNVFLSGPTNSRGAPGSAYVMATPGSHQDTLNAPPGLWYPQSDVYIAMFDSTGRRKWGTYYGGSEAEYVGKTVVDYSSGAIYLCGSTGSASAIATPGVFQPALDVSMGPGSAQGFLVRFLPLDIAIDSITRPLYDTLCAGNLPLSVRVSNRGKLAKTDPLIITYTCAGPVNGSATQSFSASLAPGATQVYNLGTLDMTLPGVYDLAVYLHYTSDDNDFDNDTLHIRKFVVTPPSAAISSYFTGNTYYFSNYDNQPGNTYLWDLGDGTGSDQATVVHTYPDKDSSYLVVLTVSNACGSSTDSVRIQTDGSGNGTGIGNIDLERFVDVYPNPAQSFAKVTAAPGLSLLAIELVQAQGIVKRFEVHNPERNRINLEALPPGLYLLRITTAKGIIHKKLVLIK
ncbi:SBBP repeat-containing protein [Taibaiella chishuiensis]|uniref:Putative secreted protein (Por secretion system target) n=1 Tax=Taibaiella chishuiensis TaxID=1434707 RepID=A0A2P8D7K8_9BACT|nr:SBBP repeat-containing protein [Taibaiella chishuiensis]PSK93171.1 putative secreted protein (Por secretion system target) [Taibaiella chishuiensis]